MPLKAKLWLGKILDWDKDGLRVILVSLAVTAAFALFIVVGEIRESSSGECDAACEEQIERAIDQHFPNVDQIINDAIEEAQR